MTDQITVTGNLTGDPVRRGAEGAPPVASFGLASTERRLENGVWVDAHTNFYSVSAFRGLAENVLQSLARGQRVIVVGKLRLRPWDQNGRSGVTADIDATSVGPDLLFGVTSFVKSQKSAFPARGGGEDGPGMPHGTVDDDLGADPGDGAPELVGVQGWAAPGTEDPTPF